VSGLRGLPALLNMLCLIALRSTVTVTEKGTVTRKTIPEDPFGLFCVFCFFCLFVTLGVRSARRPMRSGEEESATPRQTENTTDVCETVKGGSRCAFIAGPRPKIRHLSSLTSSARPMKPSYFTLVLLVVFGSLPCVDAWRELVVFPSVRNLPCDFSTDISLGGTLLSKTVKRITEGSRGPPTTGDLLDVFSFAALRRSDCFEFPLRD